MRYSPILVQPMREDLMRIGFEEWKTPEEVDAGMANAEGRTAEEISTNLTAAFDEHCTG